MAPELVAGAEAVHEVRQGRVDEIAGELLTQVEGPLVVALGGGRVIDTAKALAAAVPGRRAAAVPTTLSAAEMTAIHRLPSGVAPDTPRVRPAVVVNDPRLSASQPTAALVASALNALGHAAEGPLTRRASPVPSLAGLEAARLIAGALAEPEPDREALALAALLSGYAIDAAGYGLHHVMSQTLVRFAGVGHGPANAAMLAHTLPALALRAPEGISRLAGAVGGDPVALASRLAERAQAARLRDLGVAREDLDGLARHASGREELGAIPPAPGLDELLAIYEAAW